MYLDKRLLRLTRGVRRRILAAAFVGLCAVFAGLGRLTLSGLVIAGVLLGKPFPSLILPIGGIIGCTVFRGLMQFFRDGSAREPRRGLKSSSEGNFLRIRLPWDRGNSTRAEPAMC